MLWIEKERFLWEKKHAILLSAAAEPSIERKKNIRILSTGSAELKVR